MDEYSLHVYSSFDAYIKCWKSKDKLVLNDVIDSDIHVYLSTCKLTADCSQHSLYGIHDFIDCIPETDSFTYEITNFICRKKSNKIRQYSEVACIASNDSGEYFEFVATFSNIWLENKESLKIIEMRMDVNPFSGNLFNYFNKTWLFEPKNAILSGTIHLPCIFPELDNPYRYGNGNMDSISEVIKRFFYGYDQLHFIHVCDVIDDAFKGGKYEYITKQKFMRQPYRYYNHPYTIDTKVMDNNHVIVRLKSILSAFKPLNITLVKRITTYKIIDIKECCDE